MKSTLSIFSYSASIACTLMLSFCFVSVLTGQANFREDYERENPVPTSAGLPVEERVKVHQEWLEEAIAKEDTLLQILGELYLFYDYVRLNDLTGASTHIIKAEHLAAKSGNEGWQGGVAFRKAHLHTYLREPEKWLNAAQEASRLCALAGDSLCVGESYQSISAAYGYMDSFDLAHHYFELALPLLEKFGEKKHLQTALANYGNLLIGEGEPLKAIAYQKRARDLAREIGNDVNLGRAINNLANAYRMAGNIPKAIAGFEEAIEHNKRIGHYQSVVRNYAGLRQSYQAIGDYKSAIAYQEKYYSLQDSLIGSRTKLKIAELETRFMESEQALELEKSERALIESRRKTERQGTILLALLTLSLIAVIFWWRQNKRQKARIEESKKNLGVVTRLLQEKNEAMMRLQQTVTPHASSDNQLKGGASKPDTSEHINLFNQSILTETDWTEFKAYFDGSFPGYVQRLRSAFPAMTEAEERLFLLLKLNLTSKEISNILGISTSGVKKTRNRLRKKLSLSAEENLEEHVRSF
ncbi:tetratricopeptide repeat protein [Neolewinella aurantiaca]|uniref:Tetratricopeptide repeat protein n=1 Tax=Neolewinella aurantiaca TaxID=2602767 RepID=A0A5C7FX31_9BACT|nr:tetratricopeptide repeat protein [Neolewinella aurantiaca]TXF89496.1 tetratricopeptide repeat protein [Neolewinella aurantiaca]